MSALVPIESDSIVRRASDYFESLLFRLPAEIRVEIYHHALDLPRPVINLLDDFRSIQWLAISEVVFRDAAPLFYGSGNFLFILDHSYYTRSSCPRLLLKSHAETTFLHERHWTHDLLSGMLREVTIELPEQDYGSYAWESFSFHDQGLVPGLDYLSCDLTLPTCIAVKKVTIHAYSQHMGAFFDEINNILIDGLKSSENEYHWTLRFPSRQLVRAEELISPSSQPRILRRLAQALDDFERSLRRAMPAVDDIEWNWHAFGLNPDRRRGYRLICSYSLQPADSTLSGRAEVLRLYRDMHYRSDSRGRINGNDYLDYDYDVSRR